MRERIGVALIYIKVVAIIVTGTILFVIVATVWVLILAELVRGLTN